MIRAVRPVGTVLRLMRFAQTAEDLMTPDPVTIPLQATARQAASILTARGLAAAPVVNSEGHPVGSISRADLARCAGGAANPARPASEFFVLDSLISWSSTERSTPFIPELPEEVRVREIMDRRVWRLKWDASAAKVVEHLLARPVPRLYIVDGDGVLIGILAAVDVLRNLRR